MKSNRKSMYDTGVLNVSLAGGISQSCYTIEVKV